MLQPFLPAEGSRPDNHFSRRPLPRMQEWVHSWQRLTECSSKARQERILEELRCRIITTLAGKFSRARWRSTASRRRVPLEDKFSGFCLQPFATMPEVPAGHPAQVSWLAVGDC